MYESAQEIFTIHNRKVHIAKIGKWFVLYLDGNEYSRSMQYETTRNSIANLAAGIATTLADYIIADLPYDHE